MASKLLYSYIYYLFYTFICLPIVYENYKMEDVTTKGLIMVPRRRNARTTQTLWHSLEPVLVLHRVLVSGPSQPLLLRRLDARLQFLGGARQALAVDARRVRKDVLGP